MADKLEDAVEICLRQLRDMQLAVAIARVYEGDNGSVLKKILHDEVLVFAAQEGDRWLASWTFWMLGRKDMAVRALIVSSLPPCNRLWDICLTNWVDTSIHTARDPKFS